MPNAPFPPHIGVGFTCLSLACTKCAFGKGLGAPPWILNKFSCSRDLLASVLFWNRCLLSLLFCCSLFDYSVRNMHVF